MKKSNFYGKGLFSAGNCDIYCWSVHIFTVFSMSSNSCQNHSYYAVTDGKVQCVFPQA